MGAHTPGPWPVAPSRFGTDHFTVGDRPPFVAAVKREEDARLIAAAPELLEALRDMVSDRECLSDKTVAFARAAIAKATGAQP